MTDVIHITPHTTHVEGTVGAVRYLTNRKYDSATIVEILSGVNK